MPPTPSFGQERVWPVDCKVAQATAHVPKPTGMRWAWPGAVPAAPSGPCRAGQAGPARPGWLHPPGGPGPGGAGWAGLAGRAGPGPGWPGRPAGRPAGRRQGEGKGAGQGRPPLGGPSAWIPCLYSTHAGTLLGSADLGTLLVRKRDFVVPSCITNVAAIVPYNARKAQVKHKERLEQE